MRVRLSVLMFLSLAFAARAQDRPTITVLDFKTNNVSQGDMQSIVSYLSASLFDADAFTVIDSTQRDAILKELEFSTTDCTDESCQLEIGKLLSAELIVIGDIGKVGTRYMLTAKMLETETSKTVSTAKGIYADLDALLDEMGLIADRLAGLGGGPAEAAVPAAEPAAEAGAVQPSGAEPAFGPAKAAGPEPEERKPRAPRKPVRPARVAAWATLGVGAAGAGIGGYLVSSALAFRTDVLEPSYAAYQEEDPDLGGQSARDYYDGLWSAYVDNVSAYKSKVILATAVIGGGVLFLGGSVVLFLIPAPKAGPEVSLILQPNGSGVMLGLRLAYGQEVGR